MVKGPVVSVLWFCDRCSVWSVDGGLSVVDGFVIRLCRYDKLNLNSHVFCFIRGQWIYQKVFLNQFCQYFSFYNIFSIVFVNIYLF